MIEQDHLTHISRPFKKEFPAVMRTLSSILDSIEVEIDAPWAFVGGIARDLYLGHPYNDLDIVSTRPLKVLQTLSDMGLYEESPQEYGVRSQDYFVDPYHTSERHPIHIFATASNFGYAPSSFDFTMNQIALKSDGCFYATAKVWRDLDKGRIRRVQELVTTTLLMRAIRFTHRFGFDIEEAFQQEIKERIQANPLDTAYFIRQATKMIEDDVAEPCLLHMKQWGVKEVQDFDSLQAAIAHCLKPDTERFEENTRDYYRDSLAQATPVPVPDGPPGDDTLPF